MNPEVWSLGVESTRFIYLFMCLAETSIHWIFHSDSWCPVQTGIGMDPVWRDWEWGL